MGLREKMNQNPTVVAGAAGTLVVVVLGYVFYSMFSGTNSVPVTNTGTPYSDDGGKTVFYDKDTWVPPFDHGGKEADRAYLNADGSVAYLQRLTAAASKRF